MEKVKFTNSLAIHNFVFGLIKRMSLKVKEIENYVSLKMNPELTKYVCQCVEEELNKVSKQLRLKIDKSSIIKEVLTQVFGLSSDEISQIEAQIDFIADNNSIPKTNIVTSSLNAVQSLLGITQSDPSTMTSNTSVTPSITGIPQTST